MNDASNAAEPNNGPDTTPSVTEVGGEPAVVRSTGCAAARWLAEREQPATARERVQAYVASIPWTRIRQRSAEFLHLALASMRRSKRRWMLGTSIPGALLLGWMTFWPGGSAEPDLPLAPATFEGLPTVDVAPSNDPYLLESNGPSIEHLPLLAPPATSRNTALDAPTDSPFYGLDDVRSANEVQQAGFDRSAPAPFDGPAFARPNPLSVGVGDTNTTAPAAAWLTGSIEEVEDARTGHGPSVFAPSTFPVGNSDHRGPIEPPQFDRGLEIEETAIQPASASSSAGTGLVIQPARPGSSGTPAIRPR